MKGTGIRSRAFRRAWFFAISIPIGFLLPSAGRAAAGESAAPGAGLDEVLKRIAAYRQGESREALYLLEQTVISTSALRPETDRAKALGDLASKIAAALSGTATAEGKGFFLKQLSVIGTEAEVPAVAPLLLDGDLSYMARYALERIPGPAAGKALREALARAGGKLKAGIVNSLGERGESGAVGEIAPLLLDGDREIAAAAAAALGKLGGEEARKALLEAIPKAPPELRPALADASLGCAEKNLAEGKMEAAKEIYGRLYARGEPAAARLAALRGLALLDPKEGVGLLDEALSKGDGKARGFAVQLARELLSRGDDEKRREAVKVFLGSKSPPLVKEAMLALRSLVKPRNLALGAKASSPDGLEGDGASSGDSAAIDGNPETYWDEVDGKPLYRLKVEFPEPAVVSSIKIVGYGPRSFSPKDFEVLCDGKSILTVTDAEYEPGTNEFSAFFPAVRCASLELAIAGYYGGSPGIRELEIYNLPDPSSPASDGKTGTGEGSSRRKVEGSAGTRVREKLDRGLIAVALEGRRAYLSFRLLGSDPPGARFEIFREADGGPPVKITPEPLLKTTDFIDASPEGAKECRYTVRPAGGGPASPDSKSAAVRPSETGRPYLSIPLKSKDTFQKAAIADLDGDGRLDFAIKRPDENVDPWYRYWKRSEGTYSIEAYLQDGTFLWARDLGWSIEQGIWYSPYIACDLDGDGRAEVAAKTGEGDPRDPDGKVTSGPEYLSIWDGMTGSERDRVPWPSREGFTGEHAYNYYCRNQMAPAYLDGKTPCLVVVRGTYNRIVAVAYELSGGKLRELWRWTDSESGKAFRGQGAHTMHAADIDGDGRDEVLLGSAVLDDDGGGLWSTGRGHPDHFYVGEIDPRRPGLEIYFGIEPPQRTGGMCLVAAATGKEIWALQEPTRHVHSSGLCADIDPAHPGLECYAGEQELKEKRWLFSAGGELIDTCDLGLAPRAVFWDGDLRKELVLDGRIRKYKGPEIPPRIEGKVVGFGDIVGDWREELIVSVPGELRIYTTTIAASDRRITLLEDPIYRLDMAVQSMGYTQIPMLSRSLAGKE